MSKLTWDDPTSRLYEHGVDRGVFYDSLSVGTAWNGLTSVKEDVDNAGQTIVYVDGIKTVNRAIIGTFSATIEALTYPDEFLPYDGYGVPIFTGQTRPTFGLCYRSMLNETDYKLHIVYNCLAKPTDRSNTTLTSSMDILAFSWGLTTTPVAFPYNRPASHIFIDSRNVVAEALEAIENILYGTEGGNNSRLPDIAEILSIFEANAIFQVTDNGDGTATVTGPDDAVFQDPIDPTKWTLDYISVIKIADDTYQATSF